MTPGARVAAAIEILDAIKGGAAAEQALLRWTRASRFAGSKDRAAIRDHVFDALRHWRSDAIRGGGSDGRARMLGAMRRQDVDLELIFNGIGHAPHLVSEEETKQHGLPEGAAALDVPDWIWTLMSGVPDATSIAQAWKDRAPVTLRVHTGRTSLSEVQDLLGASGIPCSLNDRAQAALTITQGTRRIKDHSLFRDGLIELQDASSQAVIDDLPDAPRVLDYCAGGGGKALSMAAQGRHVTAYDINHKRMSDLPERARRAGTPIAIATKEDLAGARPFDLVLCDAPCSGSGAWRRNPEGKWTLTPDRLKSLQDMQLSVLEQGKAHVSDVGFLVYATCSVFPHENSEIVSKFVQRNPNWRVIQSQSWPVDEKGDGFFSAHLTRG